MDTTYIYFGFHYQLHNNIKLFKVKAQKGITIIKYSLESFKSKPYKYQINLNINNWF